MALTQAVISFDISDLAGADFDPRRTKVYATNNVVGGAVVDTDGNKVYLGSGNATIAADGTGTISVPTPGLFSNPDSWQTTIHVDYPDRNTPKGRATRSFGPFTITASANLADLVPEQEVPAEYVTLVTAQLDAKVTEAETAATSAAASAAQAKSVAEIDTSDALVTTLVNDPASTTKAALSATYAKRKRGILGSAGAVCFTWDDGWAIQNTIRQMADARHQRHVFAITTALLDTADHLTTAQMLTAHANGHEIASHSVVHTGSTDLATSARVTQYDDSKAALEALIGVGRVRTWVYPYGAAKRSATTDKELYLRYDRILSTSTETGDTASPFLYRRDELRAGTAPFLIGRYPWTSTNHAHVLNLIRQTATQPIVLLLYGHNPGAANDPTLAQVTEAMDLVQSLGIDTVTSAEAFPPQSILADPGFEDTTLASWMRRVSAGGATNLAETVVDTPADGFPGARSLHLKQNDTSGTGYVYVTQQIPIIPGIEYTMSFRYRSATTGTGAPRARVRTRDYVGGVIAQHQGSLSQTQATWLGQTIVFTPAATAVSASVEFIVENSTGEAWFDHVHIGPTMLGVYG